MNDINQIVQLIRKDLRAALNADEAAALQTWAASDPAFQQLLEDVSTEERLSGELKKYDHLYKDQASIDRMLLTVQRGIDTMHDEAIPMRWYSGYKKWLVAAAVLLVFSLGYLLLIRKGKQVTPVVEQLAEIRPATNKATLTLADGVAHELNNEQSGIIVDGQQVRYADSSLVPLSLPPAGENQLNVLETSTGGQYRIVLPDGSKVWLNALTTLRYPTRFARDKRVVELDGEAFFEVDHNPYNTGKPVPFVVKSRGQEVTVLGTVFNINCYSDEARVRTTLINGSVAVKNLASLAVNKLTPGMQSDVHDEHTSIEKADIFSATAWKDGFFSFRNAGVEDLMKQLRRWYGVEVRFEGTIPSMVINGEVNRNMSANKVFEVLDYLDIAFRIDNNRIIISNKRL